MRLPTRALCLALLALLAGSLRGQSIDWKKDECAASAIIRPTAFDDQVKRACKKFDTWLKDEKPSQKKWACLLKRLKELKDKVKLTTANNTTQKNKLKLANALMMTLPDEIGTVQGSNKVYSRFFAASLNPVLIDGDYFHTADDVGDTWASKDLPPETPQNKKDRECGSDILLAAALMHEAHHSKTLKNTRKQSSPTSPVVSTSADDKRAWNKNEAERHCVEIEIIDCYLKQKLIKDEKVIATLMERVKFLKPRKKKYQKKSH